ncbi:ABC transporter substrate-binding protein [Arthrobacter sp. NPDC090010]|uniref:ABC transporter substrate-binding protein n=1 Tax=Arthrobacter sp. NPDC090010 TaxID=3363942 RepID=UPI0038231EE8
MQKKKILAGAAVLLTAMLGMSACSNGGSGQDSAQSQTIDGEITLQTWALTPKFSDYLNKVIADFEKANPQAKVKLLDQPGDGYSEKVLSQASSNTLPDVINLPNDFAYPLAQQGVLEDLSQGDDLAKSYVPGALDAYKFPGIDGTYAYPWYIQTDVNYWNTDQLSACGLDAGKLPTSTAELFTQAKTMHDKCPDKYLISTLPGLNALTATGQKAMSDDGKNFTFATDEAAAVIDKYRDAYKAGYMPPSILNNNYQGNAKLFTQQKVAWTTAGSSGALSFVQDNPSLKGKFTENKALDTPPLYPQGLSVSAKSKHLATAKAFAKFMTNAENQNAFAKLTNTFPSSTGSSEDSFYSKEDGTEAGKARVIAFNSLKEGKVLNPVQWNSAMDDYFKQQVALAVKGDISSKDALQKAQDKANQLLQQQK